MIVFLKVSFKDSSNDCRAKLSIGNCSISRRSSLKRLFYIKKVEFL